MPDGFEIDINLAEFDSFLKKAEKEGIDGASVILRKLTLDLLSDVVLNTRYKEGTMRGNWQVSRNILPNDVLDMKDPTGQKAMRRAQAALRVTKPTDTIFIYNNLAYTEFWESRDRMLQNGIDRILRA